LRFTASDMNALPSFGGGLNLGRRIPM